MTDLIAVFEPIVYLIRHLLTVPILPNVNLGMVLFVMIVTTFIFKITKRWLR